MVIPMLELYASETRAFKSLNCEVLFLQFVVLPGYPGPAGPVGFTGATGASGATGATGK